MTKLFSKRCAALLCAGALALSVSPLANAAATYDIAVGDQLSIKVYRQGDLSMGVRVDPRGFIQYPVAGRFVAAGKSANDLAHEITRALLRKGYSDPDVVIEISSFAPRCVYIIGQVQSTPELRIPLGSEITAMQAIAKAGGLTGTADLDRVVVRRPSGSDFTNLPVPARDILNGKVVKDVVLRPDDTIVVPKMKPITVLGTVGKPGNYYPTPEAPLTMTRLIASCGGVSRPNSLSEIRLTRGGKTVTVDVRRIIDEGKEGEDPVLQQGDVVYVPETRW